MAGSSGDIIQVSLEGLTASVVFRNVFYYRLDDAPTAGYLDGLLTEFQTGVLTPYAATLTTAYTFTELTATNIFTGDVSVDVTPSPAAGTRAVSGDNMNSFTAAMIILERQNARVRNGRKFIPVPLETDVSGNIFASGFVTLLNTLAAAMDNSLNPGGTDTFIPAIVGRIPYTTSSGRTAYRLPVSQGEMGDKYSLVDTARAVNRVTTMNSRKFWRGE